MDDGEWRVFFFSHFVWDRRRGNDDLVCLAINLEGGIEIGRNRWCIRWSGKSAVVVRACAHRGGTAVKGVLGVPEPDREAGGGDRKHDAEDQSCFAQKHGTKVKDF